LILKRQIFAKSEVSGQLRGQSWHSEDSPKGSPNAPLCPTFVVHASTKRSNAIALIEKYITFLGWQHTRKFHFQARYMKLNLEHCHRNSLPLIPVRLTNVQLMYAKEVIFLGCCNIMDEGKQMSMQLHETQKSSKSITLNQNSLCNDQLREWSSFRHRWLSLSWTESYLSFWGGVA
jgi:hypothetical protein